VGVGREQLGRHPGPGLAEVTHGDAAQLQAGARAAAERGRPGQEAVGDLGAHGAGADEPHAQLGGGGHAAYSR